MSISSVYFSFSIFLEKIEMNIYIHDTSEIHKYYRKENLETVTNKFAQRNKLEQKHQNSSLVSFRFKNTDDIYDAIVIKPLRPCL